MKLLSTIIFCLLLVYCVSVCQAQSKRDSSGQFYLKQAVFHHNNDLADSAMYYARLAYQWHLRESNSLDSQIISGLQLATTLNKKGKNEEALTLILETITKAEQGNNDTLLAQGFGHAGIIYNHLYMDKDAQEMLQKSYDLYLLSDTLKAYQQLNNLSLLKSRSTSTVDEALEDQRMIYQYQVGRSGANDLARTLINLGVIFTELDMHDSAIHYLQKVIPMESSIKKSTFENANYYLSMTHSELGNTKTALSFALRSYELSIELGTPSKVAYASQRLSRIYKQSKNYKQALYYYAQADSLTGQAFHENYSRRISELKVKYESEQKQREIERLNYENQLAEKQKFIYLILVILLVSVFAFFLNRFVKKSNTQQVEIKSQKIEKARVEKELEFKKNEFASNSLNLIQKDGLLKDIKESIQEVRKNESLTLDTSEELRHLVSKLDFNLNIQKNWEDFKLHFEQIHGDFSKTLSCRYPQLSANELRLCSLIKIGLSVKEMATLLNISPQGVKTARYRLRKKLGLKKEDKLLSFLHAIEEDVSEVF